MCLTEKQQIQNFIVFCLTRPGLGPHDLPHLIITPAMWVMMYNDITMLIKMFCIELYQNRKARDRCNSPRGVLDSTFQVGLAKVFKFSILTIKLNYYKYIPEKSYLIHE